MFIKIKTQTRYNDFKNKGLKTEYFKNNLVKMQNELISRICMVSEGEKKIEEGSFNMIGRKRNRNPKDTGASNPSSDSSSSSSSGDSEKSINSSKSVKKINLNKKAKG